MLFIIPGSQGADDNAAISEKCRKKRGGTPPRVAQRRQVRQIHVLERGSACMKNHRKTAGKGNYTRALLIADAGDEYKNGANS